MTKTAWFVVFRLDELRYALPLACVEKVIRMVEITPLPKAPEIVPGIINVQGKIIPVVDVRKRFRLPVREFEVDDQIMIARVPKRLLALPVDLVQGLAEYPAGDVVVPEKIIAGTEYLAGVLKLPDGLILIHDLEKFLSLEEEIVLKDALSGEAGDG